MLAVTQVNGCRYCSYLHTKNALETGISEAEIQDLLKAQPTTEAAHRQRMRRFDIVDLTGLLRPVRSARRQIERLVTA